MASNGAPNLLQPLATTAVTLLTADGISSSALGYGPRWGIFSGGGPVVTADTVVEFSYREEYTISDFPLETGAFASYDKVYQPFDVRVRYVAGGSEGNRASLLNSIKAIAPTLQLFSVVSPEATYINANVVHYDYRRTSREGLKLLAVDVWLKEVRQLGSSSVSVGGVSVSGQASGISINGNLSVGGISLSGGVSLGAGFTVNGGISLTNTAIAASASPINIGPVSAVSPGSLGTSAAQFPTTAQLASAFNTAAASVSSAVSSFTTSLGF